MQRGGGQKIVQKERGWKRKKREKGEGEGQEGGALLKGKVPLALTECHRKVTLQRAGPTLFSSSQMSHT